MTTIKSQMPNVHKSVLVSEVVNGLNIQPSDIFLDGTINGGGHSAVAYGRLDENGAIIGLDLDNTALDRARARLIGRAAKVILKQASFSNLAEVLVEVKIPVVDKILFDLGLSSNQLEMSGRGFSFQKNEPLLMTFKDKPDTSDLTAADIVNRWDEENIAQIIKSYGEERFAHRIASAIISAREEKEIKTAAELADIIRMAVPKRFQGRIHPATRTFQALRITVNDEIGALQEGLRQGFEHLRKEGGRMAVISFHSLEDRMVKNFFKEKVVSGKGKLITRKPVVPEKEEIAANTRARSAKLRIIEKTA